MKKIINLLSIVTLGFITLFSCGGGGSTASIDESEKSEKIANSSNPTDNLSKKEVIDRMNKANNINQISGQMSETDKLVDAVKNQKTRRLGEDQAKQSTEEQVRRYEEVKDLPATTKQKKVANQVCSCLNDNPLFKTVKKSKSGKALIKSLGQDKDKEVRAMQNCYNKIMVPAIKDLGKDAGIFSKKSREYLNNQCLKGNNDFWVSIGAYLARNNAKSTPKPASEKQ